MEREKPATQLPYGVSPVVRSFLLDCIKYGVVSELNQPQTPVKVFHPERNRNIIGSYFASEATSYDLAVIYGISRERVTGIIKWGMLRMWAALPLEVKNGYKREDILELKEVHSPRAIRKLSEARRGQPSPFKGVKRSAEIVEKSRQRSIQLWQDPAFREKTITAQKEWRKKRGRGQKKEERTRVEKKEKSEFDNNRGTLVSEAVLQSLVADFIKSQKKKKELTVDDVYRYLQHLGVRFEQQQVKDIIDKIFPDFL